MNPKHANVHDPFAITINASLKETLTGYDMVDHVARESSRFCRYFLSYRGLSSRKESKGRVVQEVSHSERWNENHKNYGCEKAQGFAGGFQQN